MSMRPNVCMTRVTIASMLARSPTSVLTKRLLRPSPPTPAEVSRAAASSISTHATSAPASASASAVALPMPCPAPVTIATRPARLMVFAPSIVCRLRRPHARSDPTRNACRVMHRLLFLEPGHFHATLTLREPHPRVADEIVVYAPDGPERRDFLTLVERFNQRAANPTRWHVDVVTAADACARLIEERRGDVVVLAGKNGGKARTMRRLHDAGFHVLADKPWLVHADDLDDGRASLAG